MKMNITAGYALMAAGYLAEHADEGPVTAATISEKYGIPLDYLIRILQQMAKFNVLKSKRGPRGGFALGRPAKDISLLEIIEAADGPIAHIGDLTELTVNTPLTNNLEKVCRQASDKAVAVFKKASLGQTIGK